MPAVSSPVSRSATVIGAAATAKSNLLANTLTHGAPDGTITVKAVVINGRFELSVANPGQAIPPEVAEHLFKPFVWASAKSTRQELGLYIASEIALAHNGTLTVASSDVETRFLMSFDAL